MQIGENIKIKELKKEIQKFSNRLMNLLIEKAELYKIGLHIKSQYILRIGVYELERFRLFFNIQKIRREIAIYQIASNRGEVITPKEVEELIAEDVKEFQRQLDFLVAQHEFAKAYMEAETLTEEEVKEIRKLYREIVKKLHPDLNPDLDEELKSLWNITQQAYADNNLPRMREIKEILDGKDIIIHEENEIERLNNQKLTLQRRIYEEKLRIKDMKEEFPYNKSSIIEDEEMIKAIVSEIEAEIEQYEKIYQELQVRLDFIKDPQRGIS